MRHLFSPDGEQALAAVLQRQPLLAFDFDGTLAPIVAQPDDAKVSASVALALSRLVQLRPVAIITGRAVADVAPRLGFEPHFIVGNHGAEDPASGAAQYPNPALDGLRGRVDAQAAELHAAGVLVEDKHHSLAFHYRLARDREHAQRRIESLLQQLEPDLKVFGGKCVLNVVAAGAPDKADAVATLVRRAGAGSALFIGDDVNDEAVFERAEPGWLTIRIGREDPSSRAMFFLDSSSEVAAMLQKMLSRLDPH